MKIGQKVMYFKKGDDHVRSMDGYIGKIFTIGSINWSGGEWIRFVEDHGRFRFDASAIMPIVASIR